MRVLSIGLVLLLSCAIGYCATTGNVDPRYNVRCEPGQVVICMSGACNPGVMFVCQASYLTKTMRLNDLKGEAVRRNTGLLGLSGEILWFLNLYLERTKEVERQRQLCAGYTADAKNFDAKAANYQGLARKAGSAKDRNRYLQAARDCSCQAAASRANATQCLARIDGIVKDLSRQAPRCVRVCKA